MTISGETFSDLTKKEPDGKRAQSKEPDKKSDEQKQGGWWQVSRHPLFQAVLFVLFNILEFLVLELFFNVFAFQYEWQIFCKNLAILMGVNLILTGLFHGIRHAFILSSVLCLVIGIANYFLISFRGYGIVYMDFYAVGTAAEVAGGYDYRVTAELAGDVITGAALVVLSFCLPRRRHPYRSLKYSLISLGGILASALFFFWTVFDTVFYKDVSSLSWDHSIGMEQYGYVLYFMANAGKAQVKPPYGYSAEWADRILSRYEEKGASKAMGNALGKNGKTPDIIMIMNESFADLSVLGHFSTNKEVLPFYHSLNQNVIKGYAKSSVYGGYTANSEFEFLTGATKAFLPGNPYLQYIEDDLPNLITTIKAQGNYKTAIAMHPYKPSGYNRISVYPLMGFDTFLSEKDFSKKNLVRDFVGDSADYQKIIEEYEKKEPDSSLCLFNVTMQNHNPYDDTDYHFAEPVHITDVSSSHSVNQYLSLMKMSDNALKELIGYFKKQTDPVIILLFGDHQPHLPDEFYTEVVGTAPKLFTSKQVMAKHTVPFMIWANYDIEEKQVENTSLNYLSLYLLQAAGLELSDYDRFLLDLQKKIPSISQNGYYDENGTLHCFEGDDGEYETLLKEYEVVQYNYLFGGKERLDKHYAMSAENQARTK